MTAAEDRAKAKERRSQAAELRLAGLTYQAIADRLGFSSVSGAYNATQLGLRSKHEDPDVLRLELERLDAMLGGVWAKARRGDLGAVDRVLKITEARLRIHERLEARGDAPPAPSPAGTPGPGESPVERVKRVADELAARRAAQSGA